MVMIAPLVVAGAITAGGAWWANRQRQKEAKKDRNFQERMSSTSWQRGVADMEAAGLNPALAYGKGGASSPGGAMAGVENVTEGAVSSAQHAQRQEAEIKLLTQQEMLARSSRREKDWLAKESEARTGRTIQGELNDMVQNRILRLQLPWLDASAKAIQRFPSAAMLQLIMNSGGSQAMGMAGTLGGARLLRGARSGIGGVFRPQRVRFELPSGYRSGGR